MLQVAPHQRRADAASGGAARHGEVVQVQAVRTVRRAEGAVQWRDLAGQGAVAKQVGAQAVRILGDPGQFGKAVQALADDRGAFKQLVGVGLFLDCQNGRDVVLAHQAQVVIHGQFGRDRSMGFRGSREGAGQSVDSGGDAQGLSPHDTAAQLFQIGAGKYAPCAGAGICGAQSVIQTRALQSAVHGNQVIGALLILELIDDPGGELVGGAAQPLAVLHGGHRLQLAVDLEGCLATNLMMTEFMLVQRRQITLESFAQDIAAADQAWQLNGGVQSGGNLTDPAIAIGIRSPLIAPVHPPVGVGMEGLSVVPDRRSIVQRPCQ
ncbi:hypothetical protein D3C86_1263520 [compost metagenome]